VHLIMSSHFQISVTVAENQVELLSDLFSELGAQAVTMTDAKDEPLFQTAPEENPLWQHTTLHALFNTDISADHIVQSIKHDHREFDDIHFYVEKIADANWVETTQKQFHPQQFGDLWICPQWEKQSWEKKQGRNKNSVVFIEPGLAFGTGTHPTTQLCLHWLATHTLKNKTIIDYGCGSGILALAALALNAQKVWATDHDHQALISTANNENYNTFKNRLSIVTTEEIKNARAEIIVANILANTLINLSECLRELLLPNGKLILSGVLIEDADRVAKEYEKHFTHTLTLEKEEWVLMAFQLK